MPPKKKSQVCPICEELILDAVGRKPGHDSIKCKGTFSSWMHHKCAGLSKAAFDAACKSKDPFYCFQSRLDSQQQEIDSLKLLVSSLSTKSKQPCLLLR